VIYTVDDMAGKLEIFLSDIAAGAVAGRVGEADYAAVTDMKRMTYGDVKNLDITNPYGYGTHDDSPVWCITVESDGRSYVLYLDCRGTFVGESKDNYVLILE